jgi:signal transduction histidine kinase
MSTVPIKSGVDIKYYLSNWIDITEEKRLKENMQFYITQITKAQEKERKRIARELHDETVQSLAALYINIHTMIMNDNTLSLNTKKRLEQIGSNVNYILEEVRRFSHKLRPGLLEKLGLMSSLDFIVEDLNREENLKCVVELSGYERRLLVETEVLLFRIAQEALTNVRKHSMATSAVVNVEFKDDSVKLTISDNGIGFEVPRELGSLAQLGKLGLIGMQERTRLLNGRFSIESEMHKGTSLTVELPILPSSIEAKEMEF